MSVDVIVREVGLRDGLQLVKSFVPTETKIKWLKAVAAAGVPEVEVTNFVPAKVIPQFADAADVARAALEIEGPSGWRGHHYTIYGADPAVLLTYAGTPIKMPGAP